MSVDWGDVVTRLGPVAVGLGGLGLAAYQARLGKEERASERTAAIRLALYDKQVEAAFAVGRALDAFMSTAINEFTTEQMAHPREALDDAARIRLREGLAASFTTFHTIWRQSALVLPKPVNDAFGALVDVFWAVTAPDGLAHQYPAELTSSTDPAMPLANAGSAANNALREALGIEPLSEQTMQLINRSGP